MFVLLIIFSIILMMCPEALQEHGHHLVGIPGQGVLAVAEAPVVHKGPLEHGIAVHNLVHRKVGAELPLFLPILDYLPQKLEVGAVPVQQALLAPGGELGGEKAGEKVQGDAVVYHDEELVVQEDELLNCVGGGVHYILKLLVLGIEEHGEGAQKVILAFEIVIEGTLGGAGVINNIFYSGVVIAFLVEQLPCRFCQPGLGGGTCLVGHRTLLFLHYSTRLL